MVSEITVSVICTAYNHERYIRQCLEGFVMQETAFPFEVLINDDASTDGTAEIIREYEERYPGIIRAFYQETNLYSQGLSPTSYCLLPNARGKYLAFCEGDDFWTDPHKLQLQHEVMEAHPECSMCVHKVPVVSEGGSDKGYALPKGDWPECVIPSREFIGAVCEGMQFHLSSRFVRNKVERAYIEAVFKDCSPVGDVPQALYCGYAGSVYYLDRPMSRYRSGSIDGWSMWYNRASVQEILEFSRGMIEMTVGFDELTGGIYHDECQIMIERRRFNDAWRAGDYRELLKIENRKIFRTLSLKERAAIVLDAYCPKAMAAQRKFRAPVAQLRR